MNISFAMTMYSIDVEKDLHGKGYKGVDSGLLIFEKLCDKNGIKPILFATGDCIKHNPKIFKRLDKKGWDISLHGFTHRRFDELSYEEKENEIKKSIEYWKKYLNSKPRGFRAPQHSVDNDTLELLEKYKFEYDSSYTPLNLLQILFFPNKLWLGIKSFFSPLQPYYIRARLKEIPASAVIVPFVSLILRVFPKWILKIYFNIIKIVYKEPVFYAHSWDFIPMKESRIDRTFSHERFINNLNYIMELEK